MKVTTISIEMDVGTALTAIASLSVHRNICRVRATEARAKGDVDLAKVLEYTSADAGELAERIATELEGV